MAAGYVPALAYVERTSRWFDLGEQAAEAALSSPTITPFTIGTVRLGRAWLAAQRGEIEVVREHYGPLVELRDIAGTGEAVTAALPTIDRVLGQMSVTLGEPDRAIDHFEAGLTFSRNAGYRTEEAWTCHDYAATLIERALPGDREQALSLLDECQALAAEIGMRALVDRVGELRQQLEPARSNGNGRSNPAGLTDREVEVLTLIAVGHSNPEIAAYLVISINTVLHHVTNIFNKTNSRNRTEAAVFAAQAGLHKADG